MSIVIPDYVKPSVLWVLLPACLMPLTCAALYYYTQLYTNYCFKNYNYVQNMLSLISALKHLSAAQIFLAKLGRMMYNKINKKI